MKGKPSLTHRSSLRIQHLSSPARASRPERAARAAARAPERRRGLLSADARGRADSAEAGDDYALDGLTRQAFDGAHRGLLDGRDERDGPARRARAARAADAVDVVFGELRHVVV